MDTDGHLILVLCRRFVNNELLHDANAYAHVKLGSAIAYFLMLSSTQTSAVPYSCSHVIAILRPPILRRQSDLEANNVHNPDHRPAIVERRRSDGPQEILLDRFVHCLSELLFNASNNSARVLKS